MTNQTNTKESVARGWTPTAEAKMIEENRKQIAKMLQSVNQEDNNKVLN